jgi:hypothetical protein
MVAGSRVATNCGVNTLSVRPATGGAAFFRYFRGDFDALILGCHEDRGRTSLSGRADEVTE